MEEIIDSELPVSEHVRVRMEKLEELKNTGKNPFEITKYDVTENSEQIKAEFAGRENGGEEGQSGEKYCVSIAGRIMSRRIMGKAAFTDVQDGKGRIQCYVRRDDVGEDRCIDGRHDVTPHTERKVRHSRPVRDAKHGCYEGQEGQEVTPGRGVVVSVHDIQTQAAVRHVHYAHPIRHVVVRRQQRCQHRSYDQTDNEDPHQGTTQETTRPVQERSRNTIRRTRGLNHVSNMVTGLKT